MQVLAVIVRPYLHVERGNKTKGIIKIVSIFNTRNRHHRTSNALMVHVDESRNNPLMIEQTKKSDNVSCRHREGGVVNIASGSFELAKVTATIMRITGEKARLSVCIPNEDKIGTSCTGKMFTFMHFFLHFSQ